MNGRIFKFTAEIKNSVTLTEETLPVYDDSLVLVGAFAPSHANIITGFIAGNGYPLALQVSLGDKFWFTPVEKAGQISCGVITGAPINDKSITVYADEG